MANPTCTRDTLKSGAACLGGKVRDTHKARVLKVWFMAKQLAALGTTDYTASAATLKTMSDDANGITCGLDSDAIRAAELVIEYNNAVAAGATVSTAPSTLASDVACLNNYDNKMLDKMELLLRCKLGRGKAYPQ